MSDKKEIKITRGVTDVENIIKHLKDEEKKARNEAWLRENFSKLTRRKGNDDQEHADSGK